MPYKFLEHTADIKILVEEPSLDEAFKTSAQAIKQVMAEDIEVKPKIGRIIAKDEKDLKDLLYTFMEEFIYLLDADDFILSEVEDLEITRDAGGYHLTSKITGDKASDYRFSNDVKAITFNDMSIEEDNKTKKTIIQFVLDV
jgi:SHS2 domain-containing protein